MSRSPKTLDSYQHVHVSRMLAAMVTYGTAMDFSETGCGKTVCAAHLASLLADAGMLHVLVVLCPQPVESDWVVELESQGFAVFHAGRSKAKVDLSPIMTTKRTALVFNYHNLTSRNHPIASQLLIDRADANYTKKYGPLFQCTNLWTSLCQKGGVHVLMDEAHSAKNTNTKRIKALTAMLRPLSLYDPMHHRMYGGVKECYSSEIKKWFDMPELSHCGVSVSTSSSSSTTFLGPTSGRRSDKSPFWSKEDTIMQSLVNTDPDAWLTQQHLQVIKVMASQGRMFRNGTLLLTATPMDKKEQVASFLVMTRLMTSTFKLYRDMTPTGVLEAVNSLRMIDEPSYLNHHHMVQDLTRDAKDLLYQVLYSMFIHLALPVIASTMPTLEQCPDRQVVCYTVNAFMDLDEKHRHAYNEACRDAMDALRMQKEEYLSKQENNEANRRILSSLVVMERTKMPAFARLGSRTLSQNPDAKVVVFLNYCDHQTALYRTMCEQYGEDCVRLINGDTPVSDRGRYVRGFQEDSNRVRVLITSLEINSMGVDFDDVSGRHPRVVLMSPSYKTMLMHQGRGRVNRKNTKSNSYVFVVYSSAAKGINEEEKDDDDDDDNETSSCSDTDESDTDGASLKRKHGCVESRILQAVGSKTNEMRRCILMAQCGQFKREFCGMHNLPEFMESEQQEFDPLRCARQAGHSSSLFSSTSSSLLPSTSSSSSTSPSKTTPASKSKKRARDDGFTDWKDSLPVIAELDAVMESDASNRDRMRTIDLQLDHTPKKPRLDDDERRKVIEIISLL